MNEQCKCFDGIGYCCPNCFQPLRPTFVSNELPKKLEEIKKNIEDVKIPIDWFKGPKE